MVVSKLWTGEIQVNSSQRFHEEWCIYYRANRAGLPLVDKKTASSTVKHVIERESSVTNKDFHVIIAPTLISAIMCNLPSVVADILPYRTIATLRVGTRLLTEWWKFSVTGSQKSVRPVDEDDVSVVPVATSACRRVHARIVLRTAYRESTFVLPVCPNRLRRYKRVSYVLSWLKRISIVESRTDDSDFRFFDKTQLSGRTLAESRRDREPRAAPTHRHAPPHHALSGAHRGKGNDGIDRGHQRVLANGRAESFTHACWRGHSADAFMESLHNPWRINLPRRPNDRPDVLFLKLRIKKQMS